MFGNVYYKCELHLDFKTCLEYVKVQYCLRHQTSDAVQIQDIAKEQVEYYSL